MTTSRSELSIRRRYWVALTVLVVSLPFVVHGAMKSIDSMRIAPEKWISSSNTQRQEFETFRRRFEGNDVVLISWDGCTLQDPRLDAFADAVLLLPDATPAARHYERVITGRSLLRDLMDAPVRLSRETAVQRLQGTLVGDDGETTCALVVLTFDGNEQRGAAISRLKSTAQRVTNLAESDLHVAGPPHDGVAIDEQSVLGVRVYSTLCTIIAALVCTVSLRSVRVTAVIIGIACFGQGLALSLIYYGGLTLDAILIVVPPLVFILTVSAGVHLVNYYRDALRDDADESPVVRSFRRGWKPCLLATLTTAVGLGSLAVSHVTPVMLFGVIAALSLSLTTVMLLGILPGELLLRPLRNRSAERATSQLGVALPQLIIHRASWIGVCGVALMLTAGMGLGRLATSVDALALFSPTSDVVQDYEWFESQIGPVIPVEVVVEFPSDNRMGFRRRVELIHDVQQEVARVAGISGVVSALDFCPEIPESRDSESFWRTGFIYKKIRANTDELVEQNYLHEDASGQRWRVTGHVSATAGIDYARITADLQRCVTPLIAEAENSKDVTARFTGMMPLIQHIQATILDDLFRSFLTAFLLIGIAIALVLRNTRLTLLAMLPNLFPVVLILGGMGWLGVPADIGTVMTASVALGIAVDDTIHFLACYRHRISAGDDNRIAVHHAFGDCGRAMLQTTMICVLGMLVFTGSDFMPTYRFGCVMVLTLIAALVGDLLFLPALLASPWSRSSIGTATANAERVSQQPVAPALEHSNTASMSTRIQQFD